MICFKKLILTFTFLLLFGIPTFAFYPMRWVKIPVDNENIQNLYLDIESVNKHNNSLYYVVSVEKDKSTIVAVIQSIGNKAGIVKTYTYSQYKEILYNQTYYPASTKDTAREMKDITTDSLLYNANQKAFEIAR